MRQPKQILAIPFIIEENELRILILKKRHTGYWQFISGGCENDELEHNTVMREVQEEIGVKNISNLYQLETQNSIPVNVFSPDQKVSWADNILVIPETIFAFKMSCCKIELSSEHTEYKIVDYNTAIELLKWDSNKTALWELSQLLKHNLLETRSIKL